MVNILSIVAAVTALMSPVTGYLLPSDPRFASEFVNAHNRIRDQHGSSHVRWSPALANEAQAYANQCNFNHQPWELHHHGDSLAKGSAGALRGPAHVVDEFAGERDWYDYQLGTSKIPGRPIGHFSQVVWDETKEVGCGFRPDCPGDSNSREMYVCRYNPGGNVPILAEFRKNVKPPGHRLHQRDFEDRIQVSVLSTALFPEEGMLAKKKA